MVNYFVEMIFLGKIFVNFYNLNFVDMNFLRSDFINLIRVCFFYFLIVFLLIMVFEFKIVF